MSVLVSATSLSGGMLFSITWLPAVQQYCSIDHQAVDALAALASLAALSFAKEYRKVPNMATPDPIQLSKATGFRKKSTLETTTATRFMVLPTLKVTGDTPWFNTM